MPPESLETLREIIPAQSGNTPDIRVYPAQYAFFNDSHSDYYHAVSAAKAGESTFDFLHKHSG